MIRQANECLERLAALALRLAFVVAIFTAIWAWRLEQDQYRTAHPGRVMTLTAQQSDCTRNSLFAFGSGCESAITHIAFLNAGKQ